MRTFLFAFTGLLLASAASLAAVTVGQKDTFADGSTQGWSEGVNSPAIHQEQNAAGDAGFHQAIDLVDPGERLATTLGHGQEHLAFAVGDGRLCRRVILLLNVSSRRVRVLERLISRRPRNSAGETSGCRGRVRDSAVHHAGCGSLTHPEGIL